MNATTSLLRPIASMAALAWLASAAVGCGDGATGTGGSAGADVVAGGGEVSEVGGGDASAEVGSGDAIDDDGASDAGAEVGGEVGGEDSDGGGDASGEDGDGGGDTLSCPGGAGCPCTGNDGCDSALCLWTPTGKACATTCVDTCPSGQSCEQFKTGGDPIFACVSKQLTLCAPCSSDGDCTENGIEAACIDYGADGTFCGAACVADADCPGDYQCSDVGKKTKQCKRKPAFVAGAAACKADADCAAGESCSGGFCGVTKALCACSPWAVASGHSTPCSKSNEHGTCKASRACTTEGLQPCPAKDAAVEVCNAGDDDCDGVVDDLPKDATCSKKAFAAAGSAAPCQADADCSVAGEACDPASKTCRVLIGECFGTPSCTAAGAPLCNDVKTPKAELCNLEDDDCDGLIDEVYVVTTPDGVTKTVGDACGVGACKGGKVVCENLSTAKCDSAAKAKAEVCNGADDDCDGAVDDAGEVCVDGDLCTKDVCDAATQSCSNPASVACDDGNPCTTEACDKAGGVCKIAFYQGSCDDGDACTVGDACTQDGAGQASCMPGASAKVCDDGNVCTDDACDAKTGCVALPNAATVTCYGGAAGTLGVGACVSGQRACQGGVLLEACVGEVVPSKAELCDGSDDDCDGVVDNGCKAAAYALHQAGVAGAGSGQGKTFRVHGLAGRSVGSVGDGKVEVRLGFYAWVRAILGK